MKSDTLNPTLYPFRFILQILCFIFSWSLYVFFETVVMKPQAAEVSDRAGLRVSGFATHRKLRV